MRGLHGPRELEFVVLGTSWAVRAYSDNGFKDYRMSMTAPWRPWPADFRHGLPSVGRSSSPPVHSVRRVVDPQSLFPRR